MTVFNLYSKRKAMERGGDLDVYFYDNIPETLRTQIIYIWKDVIGTKSEFNEDEREVVTMYKFLTETLCREYGKFSLSNDGYNNYDDLIAFFLNETDTEKVLDVIELSFKVIDKMTRNYGYRPPCGDPNKRADDAISELNTRFKEHAIGYQFENSQLIKIDSAFLHSEIVKPVLMLLSSPVFQGSNDEFLKAHEHYRKSENKECLNYCLKSFESMMKSICKELDWSYKESDTSKTLLEICFKNELLPSFWQSHFSSLRSMLESGIPTGRNKLSGHGQGSEIIEIPVHIVSFLLHSTAASILLLGEAYKALKNKCN